MKCECCGEDFEIKIGRGHNNRISCYDCVDNNVKLSQRNKMLKKKYGITQFQYKTIFNNQNGKCAICKTNLNFTASPTNGGQKRERNDACIDHCHDTGKVRGLLCFHCNTALGHIFDNVDVLNNIRKYLNP